MATVKEQHAFGRAAQAARLEARVTMRAVADALGFTPVYISDIERGNRNPPRPEIARRWAAAVGADLDEFEWLAMTPEQRQVEELWKIANWVAGHSMANAQVCQFCGGTLYRSAARWVLPQGELVHAPDCTWVRAVELTDAREQALRG